MTSFRRVHRGRWLAAAIDMLPDDSVTRNAYHEGTSIPDLLAMSFDEATEAKGKADWALVDKLRSINIYAQHPDHHTTYELTIGPCEDATSQIALLAAALEEKQLPSPIEIACETNTWGFDMVDSDDEPMREIILAILGANVVGFDSRGVSFRRTTLGFVRLPHSA